MSRLPGPVRGLARLAAFALSILSPALLAQPVVSPGPDKVSVTVYRAPARGADDTMDLRWLGGYALVTERRTVTIPAGEAVIRFEGVASGILPESAIVTGLPQGVTEKNQDAELLSPRGLLAASTERRVTVRRTDRATGAVREEGAILRSGSDGGIVMETRDGFEALRCTGLNETIVHDSVPATLSARPTLSVRTQSAAAVTATVTLSYLADGFDWQANYVATIGGDGRSLDLFAWVTLASADTTSFVDADTQAVAGKVNRDSVGAGIRAEPDDVELHCWPYGTTSDGLASPPPPPPPPPPPAPAMMEEGVDIIVTAQRRSSAVANSPIAVQEELGDLKLYRIPMPVTVASNSQKQVAMIDAERVPADIFYRARIFGDNADDVKIMVRLRNRKEDRLGMPLPAGPVAFFQQAAGRPMLLGEGSVEDKAVGESVEIEVTDATSVTVETDSDDAGKGITIETITVANANARPISFEAEIMLDPERRLDRFSGRTVRRDGKILWPVTLAANSRTVLTYRSTEVEISETDE